MAETKPTTLEDVKEFITRKVQDKFDDETKISDESILSDFIDSLDNTELAMKIEEEFKIVIEDEEANAIHGKPISDIAAQVLRKIGDSGTTLFDVTIRPH